MQRKRIEEFSIQDRKPLEGIAVAARCEGPRSGYQIRVLADGSAEVWWRAFVPHNVPRFVAAYADEREAELAVEELQRVRE